MDTVICPTVYKNGKRKSKKVWTKNEKKSFLDFNVEKVINKIYSEHG